MKHKNATEKKVIKHLKDDIKTFRKEAHEDRELIKKIHADKKESRSHKNNEVDEKGEKHKSDKAAPTKKYTQSKKITVAKGVKVSPAVEKKMRAKPGSSNTGKYKNVSPKEFAGKSGGASAYSFPIPDLAHARNALARAHFAPNPEGIKEKVCKMYPELKKRAQARRKKK